MKLFKNIKDSIAKPERDVEKELNTIMSNFTFCSTPQAPIPAPPGYQPKESLIYYTDAKSQFEKKMIDRCYNKGRFHEN